MIKCYGIRRVVCVKVCRKYTDGNSLSIALCECHIKHVPNHFKDWGHSFSTEALDKQTGLYFLFQEEYTMLWAVLKDSPAGPCFPKYSPNFKKDE